MQALLRAIGRAVYQHFWALSATWAVFVVTLMVWGDHGLGPSDVAEVGLIFWIFPVSFAGSTIQIVDWFRYPDDDMPFEDALKHVPSVGPMPEDHNPTKPRNKKVAWKKR